MNIAADYNEWAGTYDDVANKTRDLEAIAIRKTLSEFSFENILEAGCGTGKNTSFLATIGTTVLSTDFSAEMLRRAQEKISDSNVAFEEHDLGRPWPFRKAYFDLVSFSLVLEHFDALHVIFHEAFQVLRNGGKLYIGELHPFKQYTGSKARFETMQGDTRILTCFNHHLSDYTNAATAVGFRLQAVNEWFDDGTREVPRVLTLVFEKA